mmetsp:Transcript_9555/g.23802  ORF Transcript_9555/g.23802 Transcript_9555/m.23802 type:complete len:324 (-) Transcript_9555:176-1147(-)
MTIANSAAVQGIPPQRLFSRKSQFPRGGSRRDNNRPGANWSIIATSREGEKDILSVCCVVSVFILDRDALPLDGRCQQTRRTKDGTPRLGLFQCILQPIGASQNAAFFSHKGWKVVQALRLGEQSRRRRTQNVNPQASTRGKQRGRQTRGTSSRHHHIKDSFFLDVVNHANGRRRKDHDLWLLGNLLVTRGDWCFLVESSRIFFFVLVAICFGIVLCVLLLYVLSFEMVLKPMFRRIAAHCCGCVEQGRASNHDKHCSHKQNCYNPHHRNVHWYSNAIKWFVSPSSSPFSFSNTIGGRRNLASISVGISMMQWQNGTIALLRN